VAFSLRTLGERVRWARDLAGISARRLDKLAKLSAGHARAIETGRKQTVEASTARKLASVLGVTLDWLLCGTGRRPTPESVRAAVAASTPKQHFA